jgi:hypothetical protein
MGATFTWPNGITQFAEKIALPGLQGISIECLSLRSPSTTLVDDEAG